MSNTAFLIPNECVFCNTRLFFCLNKGDLIPQINKQIRETVESLGTKGQQVREEAWGEERVGRERLPGSFLQKPEQDRQGKQAGELQPSMAFFILWHHLPGNLLMGGRGIRADP